MQEVKWDSGLLPLDKNLKLIAGPHCRVPTSGGGGFGVRGVDYAPAVFYQDYQSCSGHSACGGSRTNDQETKTGMPLLGYFSWMQAWGILHRGSLQDGQVFSLLRGEPLRQGLPIWSRPTREGWEENGQVERGWKASSREDRRNQ